MLQGTIGLLLFNSEGDSVIFELKQRPYQHPQNKDFLNYFPMEGTT